VRHRFIDWSPLRPPTQWWPESMTVTPLDESHAPIASSAVTWPLRGRCDQLRLAPPGYDELRCERHMGHPGDHWAYGRGTW
jgi:hypothetical protein